MQAIKDLRTRTLQVARNPYAIARRLSLPHMTVKRFLRGSPVNTSTLTKIESALAALPDSAEGTGK